jgi:CarD family transcriptional regulator
MEIGDTVLHPRYGVGVIHHIEQRDQDGEIREFYVIPKPSIASTILVPVDTADELGLRPISSADKLNEAIRILAGETDEDRLISGLRNLSWNDPLALAQAIRNQATEPKSRYPKVSELHQLKRAKKLLAEELSVVLGMPEDKVAALIDCKDAVPSAAVVGKA